MNLRRFHFMSSDAPLARRALQRLTRLYGQTQLDSADVVVALGGDGLMLQALHESLKSGLPVYGMNRGSVGFLMNNFAEKRLAERLAKAESTMIHPLRMRAVDAEGKRDDHLAFNEVSFLRQRFQAAKLKITIDGKVRLEEMTCDGMIVATSVGSTAYNLSAHGPILPVGASLLALTPISVFRPRRWRGAILPQSAKITVEILESEKRPVAAVADHAEVRNVAKVEISNDKKSAVRLLFDPGDGLKERVLNEQFQF